LQSAKLEDIPKLQNTKVIQKNCGLIKGFSCSSFKMKSIVKGRENYCKNVIDLNTQDLYKINFFIF